jgi:uncharacterized membrane protein
MKSFLVYRHVHRLLAPPLFVPSASGLSDRYVPFGMISAPDGSRLVRRDPVFPFSLALPRRLAMSCTISVKHARNNEHGLSWSDEIPPPAGNRGPIPDD